MKGSLLQEAIKLNKERKRKQQWNRVVRVLAGIVVFCTTYALILPAITMEIDPICGLEEHLHIEECFEKQVEQILQCPYEMGEMILHVHEESCSMEMKTLTCELLEDETHSHGEACYIVEQQLICELPTEHVHDENCYVEAEESLLVCAFAEHEHEESCYPLEKKPEFITMIQNTGVATVADMANVTVEIVGWNPLQFSDTNQFKCPVGSTIVLKMGASSAHYEEQKSITVTGGEISSATYTCDNKNHNHKVDTWCDANLTHTIEIKILSANVKISGTTNWGWTENTVTIKDSGSGEEPDQPIDPPDPPEEPDVPQLEYRSVITGNVEINRLRFYNLAENSDSGVSALAGCVFEIKNSNGEVIYELKSGNEAEINIPEDISDGEYTITEVYVPDGYLKDTRFERSFTIENGALTSSHNIGTFINHSIEKLETEKTAEVEDYNQRIYEIMIAAESHMRMYQLGPIDMLFVVDQSNSMLFPAGLVDTGKSIELKLNDWGNVQRMEALNLDKDQMYYLISDPTGTATVWSIWWEDSLNAWLYQDTSYFVKAEQGNKDGYEDPNEKAIFPQNKSYADQKNSEASGTRSNGGGLGYSLSGSGLGKDIDAQWNDTQTYKLYTAKVDEETNERYNRLHYLEEALANMIYALADINPENRVTLTGFTKVVDEANDCIGPLELTSENAEIMVDAVRSINTSGGTRQDIALKHIYENHLNDSSKGYNTDPSYNYTVLITDGAPVISSGSELDNLGSPNDAASTTANSVYAQLKGYAELVKTRSSLMTVGLGMEHVESGKAALEMIASGGDYYCALDDAAELVSKIQKILFDGFKPKESIHMEGDVVDEISDSFYPIAWVDKGTSTGRRILVENTSKDWLLLEAGDWITLDGKYTTQDASDAMGQLLQKEDGTFYIIWKNQLFSNAFRDKLERIAWVDAGTGASMGRTVLMSDGTRDWILLNEGDWITQDGEYYQGTPYWYASRYGQVVNRSGTYTIAWGNNASGNNRRYCELEPWKGIFYVKAKEDFIGGNAIETNKEAWVALHDLKKNLDDPTVNVHLLDMNEMGSEVTVYLGDVVNEAENGPIDSLKYFYEHTEITKLIADGGNILNKANATVDNGLKEETFTLKYAIGRELTDGEWQILLNGGEVNAEYIYDAQSSRGPVGRITLKLEKMGIAGATLSYEKHEAIGACQPEGKPLTENCTNPAEVYTLKITYNAYKLGENGRPQTNVHNGTEGPGIQVGTGSTLETGLGTLVKNNVHKVHVLSGTIEITKKFEEGLKDLQDRTFAFTLHRTEDGEDTSKDVTKTITIPAGEKQGTSSIIFENLRRGTYVITEAENEQYMLKEITVLDSTNCYSTPSVGATDNHVTFVMGNNISNENVIGKFTDTDVYTSYIDPINGVYGAAEFVNREIRYEGKIPVEKYWDDGADAHIGSEVYVVLCKDGVPLVDVDGRARLLMLNADNNWKDTFTVVLADAMDQVSNYDYTVKEVSKISINSLYGWHEAVLENNGTSILYYEQAVEDGGILGVQGQGYAVHYEEKENGVWLVKNYRALALPKTGGNGTYMYTISGIIAIMVALIYGYSQRYKGERRRKD